MTDDAGGGGDPTEPGTEPGEHHRLTLRSRHTGKRPGA
jgi:hypothetical protein